MPSINHLIRIGKPATKVFKALTSNEEIAAWFTQTQCDQWLEGARVTWFGDTIMDVLTLVENEVLSLQVLKGGGWDGTRLTFAVEAVEDKTIVRFDHTGWNEISDHFRDCSMSWAYFLESLKLYCETGTGTPEGVAPACESE